MATGCGCPELNALAEDVMAKQKNRNIQSHYTSFHQRMALLDTNKPKRTICVNVLW